MVCPGSEDMATKLLRETKSTASHVTEIRLWLGLRLDRTRYNLQRPAPEACSYQPGPFKVSQSSK